MKFKLLIVFSAFLCVYLPQNTVAQDTIQSTSQETKYVRILLHSGGMYEGEVIEIDEASFLINTPLLGQMRIEKTNIATIVYIQESEVGTTVYNTRNADTNPQSSRYFFAPSAHQLKKGEGYFQNGWLLYNQISYGVSDNFTAGMTLTPFGTGGSFKAGGEISDGLHMSAGAIGILPFDFGLGINPGLIRIAFINMSLGSESSNVSFSLGKSFRGLSDNSGMIVNFSAMKELNRYTWLMTENYILLNDSFDDGYVSIMSVGIRKASARRDVLWDYAMIVSPGGGGFMFPIPWISVTVPF